MDLPLPPSVPQGSPDSDTAETIIRNQEARKIAPLIAMRRQVEAKQREELMNLAFAFLGGLSTAAVLYVFYKSYKAANANAD